MVHITHDWDESDTRAELQEAFAEYRKACYGSEPLVTQQEREVKQAFLSGVHWMNSRDNYSPDDIQRALSEILNDEGFILPGSA